MLDQAANVATELFASDTSIVEALEAFVGALERAAANPRVARALTTARDRVAQGFDALLGSLLDSAMGGAQEQRFVNAGRVLGVLLDRLLARALDEPGEPPAGS